MGEDQACGDHERKTHPLKAAMVLSVIRRKMTMDERLDDEAW
jgi:hypothetical protein